MERKRCKCGILAWISPDGTADTTCPTCRPETETPAVSNLPAVITSPAHTQILRSTDIGMADLQALLHQAFAVPETRSRTFTEILFAVDLQDKQLREKAKTSAAALALLQARTTMIQEMRTLVLASRDFEDVEIESERRRRALEIEFLKLEANKLDIIEQIEMHHATRRMRVETERLREERVQDDVRSWRQPSKPKADPDEDRERRRAESTRRQAGVADFMREVAAAFSSDVSNAEKALRIRAILQVYDRELADLGRDVRDFMEEMGAGDD